MGKCKNCGTDIDDKRVYCSLKCRNVYVNKHRDYSKMKNTFEEKHKESIDNYYLNPKTCKNCGKIIEYENKQKTFCDQSCAAKFNNKKRKGLKYNLSEDGKNVLIESAYKNLLKIDNPEKYGLERLEYYKEPNKCINCGSILEFRFRYKIYCCIECKKEYFINLKNDIELYKLCSKFKFNLSDYEDNFDFDLIKKFGWYKAKNHGNNINGVSRDHMFSINEGFKQLINPLLIAHPANCKLIKNTNNQKKRTKCSITLNELLENIENFEKKYGKYYDSELKHIIILEELKEIYNYKK